MSEGKRPFKCKHFSQMTKEERIALMIMKDKITEDEVKFSDHAIKVMRQRRVKENEIIKAIKYGQIIEYRETPIDKRITIRSTFKNRKDLIVYVAVSILDNIVITTYYDRYYNIHKERNFTKYHQTLKII